MSLEVCGIYSCSRLGVTHGLGYRLVARVAQTRVDQCGENDAHLTSVKYQTTAVDDGIDLISCQTNGTVSPTSQTWTATDYAFDCTLTCSAVAGPSVTIEYD
jgi:hypothetical protein